MRNSSTLHMIFSQHKKPVNQAGNIDEANSSKKSPFDLLTRSEYEVLLLLLDGRSIDGISSTLHLNNKTVAYYHAKILHKLGIYSDIELTKLSIQHGIINP